MLLSQIKVRVLKEQVFFENYNVMLIDLASLLMLRDSFDGNCMAHTVWGILDTVSSIIKVNK